MGVMLGVNLGVVARQKGDEEEEEKMGPRPSPGSPSRNLGDPEQVV
jgi:hypothetical protein